MYALIFVSILSIKHSVNLSEYVLSTLYLITGLPEVMFQSIRQGYNEVLEICVWVHQLSLNMTRCLWHARRARHLPGTHLHASCVRFVTHKASFTCKLCMIRHTQGILDWNEIGNKKNPAKNVRVQAIEELVLTTKGHNSYRTWMT